jgi:MFS superfamily sulfate permease-like transporter
VSLALLFALERFVAKLPAALTVVVLAVLYIAIVDPSGIAIVGDIPQGLPAFGMPEFSGSDVAGLIGGALAVALIGFSEGYGAASSFARKYGDRLDNNQEFIALGVANAGAGLSSGMVVGGSLSKTAANDSSNAKSQLSGIGMAVLVVLTLLFLAPFFEKLPEATLAAVVIHALWHSANPRKLGRVLRTSRSEFLLAVTVLVVVLVLDTMPAIVLGVIISLLLLVYRVSFPRTSELVLNEDTGTFERSDAQERSAATNGVVIYRFDAPLIYANAQQFTRVAEDLVNARQPPATVLIVDCEEMFETDVTGAEELGDFVESMRDRDVVVALSRVHANVLETLARSGVLDRLGASRVFARTEDAVAALSGGTHETPPPATP